MMMMMYNVLLQTFTFSAHNMPKIGQFSSFNRFEQTLFHSCCLTDPVIPSLGGPWNSEDLSQTLHFEGIYSVLFSAFYCYSLLQSAHHGRPHRSTQQILLLPHSAT